MEDFTAVFPVQVSLSGISLSIPSKTTAVKVLDDITFDVEPGQIIAIMGSSGSGKTTLLHALAGRLSGGGDMVGSVKFDGADPAPYYTSGSVGYVQQHDHLMPYLTVRETLRYAAKLRLPNAMSLAEKYRLVENVIMELGLKECADTIIGDDWRKGISGGEKRRVSVGCQLLVNPSLLFMGTLDSF